MIAIRVDGNSEIATGHIMRCLAIANGLKKAGQDCIFIVADENSELLLSNSDFKIINLHSVWNHLDEEISLIIDVIEKNKIDKIIIDSYFVTEKYLSALEKKCRVIFIDDLNMFRYPVSVVINYNLYANDIPYPEIYRGTNTKLLLGPKYAPLRNEFQNITPHFRNQVKNILITAGGADTYNTAGKIISTVLSDDLFSGIKFHIVAGKMNHHKKELISLSEEHNEIIIHSNVKKMSELMMECDLAVTAGGSTMYELCACGVPSICFSWADNQIMGINAFSKREIMFSAGDFRDNGNECIKQIIEHLKEYIIHPDERAIRFKRACDIVDGKGVFRIVDEIICLDKTVE